MPLVDWPLPQLKEYKPALTKEADFDVFWARELAQSKAIPLNVTLTRIEYPVESVDVYDLVYDGADGTKVHGWYMVPKESLATHSLPVVVRYHGYGGSRNRYDLLQWTSMGYAALMVDTRGQAGQSPDNATYSAGAVGGHMTKGILDPNEYYYKQVYLDCVRALDFVCSREEIDPTRIAVCGNSQGGGLTLAVAGLDDRPKVSMPVFPYLCDFRRAVAQHSAGPYREIIDWFRRFDPEHLREDEVYRTLSYFDGMNMASRIKAKTLMAITLMDLICPPSTSYAAYNHLLTKEKEARIYHDYGHEGLGFHEEAMMAYLAKHL